MPVERQPLVAVLAAGRAERFGGGKLDADCAGQPLGRWALEVVEAAGLPFRFVVTGPDLPAFAAQAPGWRVIVNAHPETGLSGSVKAAWMEAVAKGVDLLLMLADMPLIEPQHLRKLVEAPGSSATRHPDGRPGVPALIRLDDQPYLRGLAGDRGAGQVLAQIPELALIDAAPESLLDVDTPTALVEAARLLRARGQ
jgi:CTP:molybdopterin cytidylyltransferase MocA